ncbi:hypothetical protein Y032_0005g2499 [Ancylostoma ceylanicum]|uniref:Uncharacterized protein n=1 Tax=Ancylostoma ceylanicum TaxID=53326 RepID=A0A016VRJ1_9BILA|nr:hypothetical protein Y032_0005g2499 [Ancylostoma ceylanicum]
MLLNFQLGVLQLAVRSGRCPGTVIGQSDELANHRAQQESRRDQHKGYGESMLQLRRSSRSWRDSAAAAHETARVIPIYLFDKDCTSKNQIP